VAEVEGLRRLPADAPLARCLERGRERFNTLVALARRQGLRCEPAALAAHLCGAVAPAVEAVAREAPGHEDAVTAALFELSLELLPREFVGPAERHPLVQRAWCELLPRVARHLATSPRPLAAALTNAAYHLGLTPGARGAEWLTRLGELAPSCTDVAQLLACGQVLAWRAGLAHYRDSALDAWRCLPDALARATLAPGTALTRAQLEHGLKEPFWHPERADRPPTLQVLGEVGGFTGLGGTFVSPPRVFVSDGCVHATDGEATFRVHADCFGQTLQRVQGPLHEEHPPGLARVRDDGGVAFRGLEARLPLLVDTSSFAATPSLLAVSLVRSHRVVLVACVGGGA
jgi:hypothetical protein